MHGSAEALDVELQLGEIETRNAVWGDQLVRWIDLPAGTDLTPLLVGLPDDRCPCPHWGYVLEGSIHLRYADGREEVTRAGELYYWPGGHTAWTDEGVVFVEFNHETEFRPVLDHLLRQLAPSSPSGGE